MARRNGKADGRFTVAVSGREHPTSSRGSAIALALDWAARLPEAGSVAIRELDAPIGAARGDGHGNAYLVGPRNGGSTPTEEEG